MKSKLGQAVVRKKLVKAFIENNGNGAEAIREVMPDKKSHYMLARHYFSKPDFQAAVIAALDENDLGHPKLAKALKEEIYDKPADTPSERAVRLNAIKMVLSIYEKFADIELEDKKNNGIQIIMEEKKVVKEDNDKSIETPASPAGRIE